MTVHVVVALDNVTLRGEDVDPTQLLIVGVIQNDFLERNLEVLGQHLTNTLLYGKSAIIIDGELNATLVPPPTA